MRCNSLFAALLLSTPLSAHVIAKRDDVPQYVPIPPSALGNKIPAEGYYVENFGQGAYMVTEGLYQAQFYVSTMGVIVVDNPPTIGHKLLYAIGNLTSLPVTHMVYSHLHADHIGGAGVVVEKYPNISIIAHKDTQTLLKLYNDSKRPLPTKVFEDDYTVCVGNQSLELSYKGLNHIDGNIFIYAPRQKVIMIVDIIYPGWAPFYELGEAKYVIGYIEAHDQILAYDFVHYVGGHIDRSGTRDDVLTQREYVHDLYTNCAKTINLTATDDPVLGIKAISEPVLAKNPGNSWAVTDTYLDVTSSYCNNLTNAKWLNRLAGSDVFGKSNAATMVESLRIDFDILGPFGLT